MGSDARAGRMRRRLGVVAALDGQRVAVHRGHVHALTVDEHVRAGRQVLGDDAPVRDAHLGACRVQRRGKGRPGESQPPPRVNLGIAETMPVGGDQDVRRVKVLEHDRRRASLLERCDRTIGERWRGGNDKAVARIRLGLLGIAVTSVVGEARAVLDGGARLPEKASV